MGIYLMPYGVKAEKVKAAFNSNDAKLLEEIKKTSVYDCYASQNSGGLTTERALQQMINGEEYDKSAPHVYGYALIALVAYLGENLTPEGDVFKIGSPNEEMEEVLANFDVEVKFEEAFFSDFSTFRFGLPRNNDFPMIGGFDKSYLKHYQKELENVDIPAEELNDFTKEGAMIFKRAVNYCLDNDLDWITFAH